MPSRGFPPSGSRIIPSAPLPHDGQSLITYLVIANFYTADDFERMKKAKKRTVRKMKPTSKANTQRENERKLPVDMTQTVFDAVRVLTCMSGEVRKYEGHPGMWDDMRIEFHRDKESAIGLLIWCEKIMREGLQSVLLWAHDKNMPTYLRMSAQRLMADMLHMLVTHKHVSKIAPLEQFGEYFQARWGQITLDGRKGSNYAVIKPYALSLVMKVENQLLPEMLDDFPAPLKTDAPAYRAGLRKIIDAVMVMARGFELKSLPTESFHSQLVGMAADDQGFEWVWSEIYWPLMRVDWPAFAREHVNFTGWKSAYNGAPISQRKRKDGTAKLSPATWEDEVKQQVKRIIRGRAVISGEGIFQLKMQDEAERQSSEIKDTKAEPVRKRRRR